MATLLRRSSRSCRVPQAASCLAAPLGPPADQAVAKDRHVLGSAGRHQVVTPSFTSSVEPPFATPSAACCRHMMRDMILRQPGAWSAEPSGLLSGP